jgi:hypothetical protein
MDLGRRALPSRRRGWLIEMTPQSRRGRGAVRASAADGTITAAWNLGSAALGIGLAAAGNIADTLLFGGSLGGGHAAGEGAERGDCCFAEWAVEIGGAGVDAGGIGRIRALSR